MAAMAAAYALALPIAWNREREARSAGMRTFPIVALAACGFVEAMEGRITDDDALARIVAGVMTGIGFIGGGAILKHGSTVHGTATAASLWATAAIGAAVGLGNLDIALTLSLFTVATLLLFSHERDREDRRD